LVWCGPNATANKGGLKLTLETQPTAIKFAFPSTKDPTKTMGMGYKKAAPISSLIFDILIFLLVCIFHYAIAIMSGILMLFVSFPQKVDTVKSNLLIS
jgi:hypothetical protein